MITRCAFGAFGSLSATCALVAGSTLAIWATPAANAATSWPNPSCGNPKDDIDLWNDVKSATPTNKGNNLEVVWPNKKQELGYATHDGTEPKKSTYNYLLIAAIRESGIECANLLDSDAPNYFKDAFDNISLLPKGTDWALGIESADNRSRDQLHIHISRLQGQARTDIDKAAKSIPTDESKWTSTIITVMGKKFRAWNVATMDHNLFTHLNDDIVKPRKVSMENETMLVTGPPPKGSGFIILNSDEKSADTKPAGANNIEFLLNKAST
jgi:CDP-diacylglycerol pyrophosphatase